ncbi:hypothetical protein CK203_049420 [Vitis vinifera]|uniref:Reverse transcriptase/retrotransposon-derived protein RNase H-like domain-containing protein n=1 Tax=Vitis vinifera TaxID=29760 RepID=A0A438HAU5_VITVI|nr:hypothetical protein CK203_049420 [Vitis vinifera]
MSKLIDLLRSNLDVFAWSYEDMPGLDPSIVKEEIQKQLSIGFLSMVEYPEWLANVVPVLKKDDKVDFPLPHIDMLIDSTAGHSMLSFMGGFTRLKNAGATYQRAATTLFHDMMHRYVEDQTVQIKIESQEVHLWVTSRKLLGHVVSERGIEVDPEKIRAILDMPALRTEERSEAFLAYYSISICAFEKIKECLLSSSVLVPPTPGRPLLLYLSISEIVMGCISVRLAFFDHHQLMNNVVEYEACITGLEIVLDLGVRQLEITGIPTWLFSRLRILMGVTMRSLLIETRSAPAYCCLIGDIEDQDGLPWYHDIISFCHVALTLSQPLSRIESFKACPECQMHGDLIHMPPSKLHALTSPWPFSIWGVDSCPIGVSANSCPAGAP